MIPQFNEPQLDSVTGATDELRALSRERVNLKYKEEFRWHMRKKEEFEDNFFKVYTLIWEVYCSSELRRAIKELPNFDVGTTKIRDDPLMLLETIENLMHTPEKAKYPVLTIVEIWNSFLKTRQGEKEELLDYLSRFKLERDVVYRLVGKNFMFSQRNYQDMPRSGQIQKG